MCRLRIFFLREPRRGNGWGEVLNTHSGWRNAMSGVGIFCCKQCGALNARGTLCFDCWAEYCNTDRMEEMINEN